MNLAFIIMKLLCAKDIVIDVALLTRVRQLGMGHLCRIVTRTSLGAQRATSAERPCASLDRTAR